MVHEISHFYQVGDEYAGGQLNPEVNIPPYGMKGTDMLHPGTAASGLNPYIHGGILAVRDNQSHVAQMQKF